MRPTHPLPSPLVTTRDVPHLWRELEHGRAHDERRGVVFCCQRQSVSACHSPQGTVGQDSLRTNDHLWEERDHEHLGVETEQGLWLDAQACISAPAGLRGIGGQGNLLCSRLRSSSFDKHGMGWDFPQSFLEITHSTSQEPGPGHLPPTLANS